MNERDEGWAFTNNKKEENGEDRERMESSVDGSQWWSWGNTHNSTCG